MKLETVEKLRELIDDKFVINGRAYLQGIGIADAIQAEVDEYYMPLPLDADGVPIRVGDKLEGWRHPIDQISFAANSIALDNCEGEHVTLHMLETDLRHVKPDPVKELLRDFARDTCATKLADYDVDEYAERIREAVGE